MLSCSIASRSSSSSGSSRKVVQVMRHLVIDCLFDLTTHIERPIAVMIAGVNRNVRATSRVPRRPRITHRTLRDANRTSSFFSYHHPRNGLRFVVLE